MIIKKKDIKNTVKKVGGSITTETMLHEPSNTSITFYYDDAGKAIINLPIRVVDAEGKSQKFNSEKIEDSYAAIEEFERIIGDWAGQDQSNIKKDLFTFYQKP